MTEYRRNDFIDPDKRVYLFRGMRTKEEIEAPHTHEFIEIMYVLDGTVDQWVDGVCYETKHGDMIILDYGTTHAFEGKTDFSYINVCFSPDLGNGAEMNGENALAHLSVSSLRRILEIMTEPRLSFFGSERKEIEDIFVAMRRERRSKRSNWGQITEGYLNILFSRMLRKAEESAARALDDVWVELSEYIDSNLDADLSLSTLSKRCFYNPSYFSRAFKEKFQMSLVEYVNRKRVDYAIELLEKSEFSIDVVSAKAGFSDRSSFYRAFAKYVKSSPSDYRLTKKK